MSANEIQPWNYSTPTQFTDFQRLGHPGRFHQVITCTSGITEFTGSNFGVGGIIVATGSVGTASFSQGGTMPLDILAQGGLRMYEFSISRVKVDAGTVYVLIRNQNIR